MDTQKTNNEALLLATFDARWIAWILKDKKAYELANMETKKKFIDAISVLQMETARFMGSK